MTLTLLLGLAAGALTTISGFGGGQLLVLALAVVMDPRQALAVSALALLVGNAHRLFLYRRELAWEVARPLLLGVVPGSLVGAVFAVGLPPLVIHVLMLAAVALSLAKAFGFFDWTLPPRALTASGLGIGAVAATAGGAGLLLNPLLLASGLSGASYQATSAIAAVGMHSCRILGYAAGHLYGRTLVLQAAALAVALVAGNLVGDAVRGWLPVGTRRAFELCAPVVALVLALASAV